MNATNRLQARKNIMKVASALEALEQRIAPAGVFKWINTGGGSWTNPANWTVVSGDAGAGYPDGTGDEAQFYNSITANSTITIPDNTEITLGKLRFDDNNTYTVASVGSGKLVMDGLSNEAVIHSTNANGTASHYITAPIALIDDTTFINVTASPLVIQTSISDYYGYASVIKKGSGVVSFAGAAANTYQGTTTVLDGTLRFAKNDGISAIGASLIIGEKDGVGFPKVVLDAGEQIADSQGVVVYDNGVFDLTGSNEAVGSLSVVDGAVVTTGSGTLIVEQIGAYSYDGVSTSTISGNLQMTGVGNIAVYNFYQEARLEVSAVLKGSVGFLKTGDGELKLSTQTPQQYTGLTRIAEGTLLLATATSDAGISNQIQIDKFGTLRIANSFEVPDSATVTITGGRMEVATTEDFKDLVLDGGTVHIEASGTFAIRPNGSVSVTANPASEGSVIEGAGKFRLNDGAVTFNIGQTKADADLTISTPTSGLQATAALLKTGVGNLALEGEGTFQGGIAVNAGVLTLASEQASQLTIGGGTVMNRQYTTSAVGGISATGGRFVPGSYTNSNGNVVFGSNATFAPYVDYYTTNLAVFGTVTLSNALLDFSVLSLPNSNFPLTIVDNDGVDAVVGTFAGLPQGATLQTPRGNFTISYTGGTGNDVTLTQVFVTPTILPGGKAATYIDSDGDLVTVKITKGTLTENNFKLVGAGVGAELAELDLNDPSFEGTSLKVTATPKNGAGDRHANIDFLDAKVDFTSISIAGDIGRFTIGSTGTPTPAFKTMVVDSVGLSAPVAAPGNSFVSTIFGNFGAWKVKGDFVGANVGAQTSGGTAGSIAIGGSVLPGPGNGLASLYVNGSVGKLTVAGDVVGGSSSTVVRVTANLGSLAIGGSIIGGSGYQAGHVSVLGNVGSVSIGRDVIGGSGKMAGVVLLSGDVGSMKIGGDLIGGDGTNSGFAKVGGDVKSVTIGKDLRGGSAFESGALQVSGRAGAVKIGGSVLGGAAGSGVYAESFGSIAIGRDVLGTVMGRASIGASGVTNPTTEVEALAIGSLTVGRHVSNADIFAGYDKDLLNPLEADAQIGKVAVKGNWTASRLVAGVDSVDGQFGNSDDQRITGGAPEITSRIASILIGGSVSGTVTLGDSFGFVAEKIGAITVAGKKLALDPANKDVIPLGLFGDMTAREI